MEELKMVYFLYCIATGLNFVFEAVVANGLQILF